jgi:sec-independent protein translocase protein TatA
LQNKLLQLNDYICLIEGKTKRKMYTGTLVEFLNMGGGEVMLILAVVLLLFGGKKLPELARGLGKGLRDFKDASEGVKREIHRNINAAGLTDEINDFKSTFNDEDSSNKHHPYDYTPNEDVYVASDEPHNTGIDLEKKDSTEHVDSEHVDETSNEKIDTDKTKI